ncbi:Dual specificity protein phosphatase 1 [Fulvia fulva]|uniref:protein-tyrosine-phosphatase n=1 Tax=Passalora fulva TaxID=5499 RepID=A0A9Q8LCE3_PASFU|nr:Dual specificity protein phosphatase 1 [Fulvia fulva]KAK4632357.1 Dual specificity protein phosphatase 1 [Fulvia fulva]KAK4632663.1 Dual specificity protein phosphatase 1 [Fulvia fulva]UJO14168.1 Dual specificity protein phosphatase 1 [Fulvia fulva]WPV10855.1 Dual specificity protein phosphatase 1 [Fulvia fulva]WPV26410.1 Dual specificity protein phosphatase 1 [Fulvia fulva]
MGWVDEAPRAGGLYIGGLHALYQRQDLFRDARITHILSVLDYDLYETGHFKDYTTMQVRLDDDPNENIVARFPDTNNFIDTAIKAGGRVFVHCAMGKSRSATIICAYLMWKFGVSPDEALSQLQEGRGVADPNPGFWEQLEVYDTMLKVEDPAEAKRVYDEWLKTRYTGDWCTRDRRRQAAAKL